jgi:hypothetical protein
MTYHSTTYFCGAGGSNSKGRMYGHWSSRFLKYLKSYNMPNREVHDICPIVVVRCAGVGDGARGASGNTVGHAGVAANCDSASGFAIFAAWSFSRRVLSVSGMVDKVYVPHFANKYSDRGSTDALLLSRHATKAVAVSIHGVSIRHLACAKFGPVKGIAEISHINVDMASTRAERVSMGLQHQVVNDYR